MVEPLDEDEVDPLCPCLWPKSMRPLLPKFGGTLVLGVCGMVGCCNDDMDCSSEVVDGDLFESAGEAAGESGQHTSFSEQPTIESHSSSSFTVFTLDG